MNPETLAARATGTTPDYVLRKNVQYIADWVGIAAWKDIPQLAPHFELVVEDPQANLAVLRRKTLASASAEP